MVQGSGQLAIGRSRGEFDIALFQSRDPVLEFIDISGGAKVQLAPDLLTQRFDLPQLLHPSGQARLVPVVVPNLMAEFLLVGVAFGRARK
ncbi:hypothetical protein ACWCRC_40355 [Streptomyces sp. NPDC001940]